MSLWWDTYLDNAAISDWDSVFRVGSDVSAADIYNLLKNATTLTQMRWANTIQISAGLTFNDGVIEIPVPVGCRGRAHVLIAGEISSVTRCETCWLTGSTRSSTTNTTTYPWPSCISATFTSNYHNLYYMDNFETVANIQYTGGSMLRLKGVTGSTPLGISVSSTPTTSKTGYSMSRKRYDNDPIMGIGYTSPSGDISQTLNAGILRTCHSILDAAQEQPVMVGCLPYIDGVTADTAGVYPEWTGDRYWPPLLIANQMHRWIPLQKLSTPRSLWVVIKKHPYDGIWPILGKIGGQEFRLDTSNVWFLSSQVSNARWFAWEVPLSDDAYAQNTTVGRCPVSEVTFSPDARWHYQSFSAWIGGQS